MVTTESVPRYVALVQRSHAAKQAAVEARLAAIEATQAAIEAKQATVDERRQVPKEPLPPRNYPGPKPQKRDEAVDKLLSALSDNPGRIDLVAACDVQALGLEKNSLHDFGCLRGVKRDALEVVGAAIRLARQGVSEEELDALNDEEVAERCGLKKAFVRSIRPIYPRVLQLMTTTKTSG
jgi:hypothetical protein